MSSSKINDLKDFETAVKSLKEELDDMQENEIKVYPKDNLYSIVDSAFNFWKTGWFLIMVKYNIEIATLPDNGYKVTLGVIE